MEWSLNSDRHNLSVVL